MSIGINTNLDSMGAQRSAARSENELATAIARLSSGLRINSARDDAAGLAISDRFTAQVRGVNQAARNANDAISLSQTAEGALGAVTDGLQRIRELAVQSANATNSASDRAALQQEVAQLVQEIDRIATQTQFNGVNLLDGSFTTRAFQVGANVGQTITVSQIDSARASALGQHQGFTLVNQSIGNVYQPAQPLSVDVAGTIYNLGTVAIDGKAIAAAINGANIPGMTATANPTEYPAGNSTTFGSGSGTGTFLINGVAIAVAGAAGPANWANNRANVVAALNAQTSLTGVVAIDTGTGVGLRAEDGRTITHFYSPGSFSGSNSYDFGLYNASHHGSTVNLSYVAPEGVSGTVTFTQSGGFASVHSIGPTGTSLAALDISSRAGAGAAIIAMDAALNSVNSSRAKLGAVQNRFASSIRDLAATAEDLTAARSRIRDADFAMETANLSRSQVLQHAGTAMVAQANQLPQQVLPLLR